MTVSGRLAQLGEHHVRNVGVVGSNPMPSTSKTPLFAICYGLVFTVYTHVPKTESIIAVIRACRRADHLR